jgi:hypothetical protein
MAQPVEIHVGAAVDGNQRAACPSSLRRHILLDAGEGQGARRLGDRAGVLEDILDRRAHLIGIGR